MAVMQLSEEQAEILSKKQPDESMSLSERLLIESAAEKDRISEPKVREIDLPCTPYVYCSELGH